MQNIETTKGKLTIVTGMQGIGKTNETMKRLYYKSEENYPVLIVDTCNELGDFVLYAPDDHENRVRIPALYTLEDGICNFIHSQDLSFGAKYQIVMSSIRRVVFPELADGKKQTAFLVQIFQSIRMSEIQSRSAKETGGCLYIEDLCRIYGTSWPKRLLLLIASFIKVSQFDVIMTFQSFSRVPKKLMQHVDVIRMHQQLDPIEMGNGGVFDPMYLAQLLIQYRYNQGDLRFCVDVDWQTRKVLHDDVEEFQGVIKKEYPNASKGALEKMFAYQGIASQ